MLDTAVLKHHPADFLVRENLVTALVDHADASHHYLLLRKSGYTTMEAVRLIADRLGLPATDITYGGLKDEDGVTEQLVALPVGTLTGQDIEPSISTDEGELSLQHYGYGADPLRIGGLEGNGFRVVVRNLPEGTAAELADRRKINLLFLNYYDTQRFGVPGGPKRTHFVGAALLEGDYSTALRELAELRAPESASARAWTGEATAYFHHELDPRTVAFYLAAHSSSLWNKTLQNLVESTCSGWIRVEQEGLPYLYPTGRGSGAAVMAVAPDLPYRRYTFENGVPIGTASTRPTVVQTVVAVSGLEADPFHPGRFAITARFFLPSGCYATAAIRQLLAHRD
ncbi:MULTISPECIES: tRNA pseudouridine(13) synthase TruD [unclassified Amycolatopsis]|uniref:tRNA pseudouridine(13) synthase TruD n=1 Tax=unclassified Amycolatopsis TaxID=2618356 RepID=UPI0028740024|nr:MULTISPECIES: tRNA pseudouridine(13) synthase TruD [unclassified Amycolatopsis]MDS0139288.1 tRNA pseudouridine(13) synthase TruD [Amycolatopsis sp. 505]MDS0144520.1 tRNA pseudouridine(13) synthase TruD [Amycolatopsis sp. CM201R]